MSRIIIQDLNNSGLDLFADRESYLKELDDSLLVAYGLKGGTSAISMNLSPLVTPLIISPLIG